jgi:catechol 2,3-dioxygenase-like lactoylglutathione lyase family enzyme
MQIEGLDHLVLTVADVGRTRDFYERVLGMEPVVFGEGRHALAFGAQKINLHEVTSTRRAGSSSPRRPCLPRAQPTCASSRTHRWPRSSSIWRHTASRSSKDP